MTMTDTEAKALALVNAHAINRRSDLDDAKHTELRCALLDAVQSQAATEARHAAELREQAERFDAFRQEVSDAVERAVDDCGHDGLRKAYIHARFFHFILPAPDPLVEVVNEAWGWRNPHPDVTENLRAALAARGGRIVWEGE